MLSYDRRIPERFLEILEPGGWASSLVDYARNGAYALDLQLRGYADKNSYRATLYVGLTNVLDLHWHATRGARLDAHATWKKIGWDPAWSRNRKKPYTKAEWSAVEGYLEAAIPRIGASYLKEGAVQSAVSGFRSHEIAVVDREAVIAFGSKQEKARVSESLSAPLLAALAAAADVPKWWNGRPKSLGGECDAIAIRDGRVLALEIKPNSATSTIPWAPVQAMQYARLFNVWTEQCDDAAEVIDGMREQRARLGLVPRATRRSRTRIKFRPAVAIGRGANPKILERMRVVQRVLEQAGLDDPPLEIYTVNLVGRLDPLESSAAVADD